MKVTIMKDNQQLYAREQAFGGSKLTEEIMRAYGMGPEEAESLKRSGTPPDNYESEILHPFIEGMAQEVARVEELQAELARLQEFETRIRRWAGIDRDAFVAGFELGEGRHARHVDAVVAQQLQQALATTFALTDQQRPHVGAGDQRLQHAGKRRLARRNVTDRNPHPRRAFRH